MVNKLKSYLLWTDAVLNNTGNISEFSIYPKVYDETSFTLFLISVTLVSDQIKLAQREREKEVRV